MSSLIFCTEETQVLVATDTLATTPDGQPFMYTTKAFILPHLRMMMAGTGAGGFLGRWFVSVNDRMIVRNIDHLNYHAPNSLPSLWSGFQKEFSFPGDLTTTVYHFGFSDITGKIHSYAYRSANGFRSESLGYGIGVKPECTVPEGCRFPNDVMSLMQDQRAIQRSRPQDQRIYIGGEVNIHHLSPDGFNVYVLSRFEDHDQDQIAIYKNFQQHKP